MAKAKTKVSPAGLTETAEPDTELQDDDLEETAAEPEIDGLDELFGGLERNEQAALKAYGGLVIDLVQGETVSPEAAREILLAARKLPADLRQRVARWKRLLQLRDEIGAAAAELAKKGPLDLARAAAIELEQQEAREVQTRHNLAHSVYGGEVMRLNALAEKSGLACVELEKIGRALDVELGIVEPRPPKPAPRPAVPAGTLSSDVAGWPGGMIPGFGVEQVR